MNGKKLQEKNKNTSFRKYHQIRIVEPFERGNGSFTRMRERTAKKIML